MSEAGWLHLADTIPQILTAVGVIFGIYVSLRNGRQSKERGAVIVDQNDAILAKAEQIHSDTNGNLTRLSNQLTAANTKSDGLQVDKENLTAAAAAKD